MLKVVVVEDEELVRKGIVLTVDWAGAGCAVVGEAANGEEGLEVIRRYRPEQVRPETLDAILEAGPWLGHFHVGENNRRPAGSTNRLPWKDMAAALKQVNYQGAIVMEPFVLMGGTIPYDIKVWRDLSSGAGEAGLDEMAGRACRFLKELTA